MYLRYSSSVVAPMHWISPRARAGFSTLEASMAPSAPPAPTSVCSSSMNRIVFFARRTSFITALIRSSNWPRYFVPATIIARSSTTIRRSSSSSGTLPSITRWAKPFDDGRLADARLAEQHRVVLGAAAENLDRPFDFLLAADDRVELPLPGQLGEIAAEAVERGRLALGALAALAALFALAAAAAAVAGATAAAAVSSPSRPWPSRLSTSSRTSSSLSPRFMSTWAATPSCSRSRPSRMCSVPT